RGAETGHVLSNSQELDSGVGRTDDSARNDESSEHDLLADEPLTPAPGATTSSSLARRHPRPSADAPALDESLPGLTQAESRRYRELVELRRRLEAGARHAPSGGRRCQGSLAPALREEMGHLEFKSRSGARAQKMRQLRARCMAAWLAGEGRPLEAEPPSPPTPPGAGDPPPRGLCDITELPERPEPTTPTTTTTTSAYNTGESCRSTPPLGERPPPGLGTASPPTSRSLPRQGAPGQRRPEGQRARRAPAGSPRCFTGLEQPAVRPEVSLPPVAGHAEGPRGDWKGRGRAEGARPPAKRPVRDRLLKARALKIREERAGMTTDDDAASEMKMGRYWSKGERKQHLARAREHRRRRELMMQSRLDWLRGSTGEHQGGEGAPRPGAGGGAELSVVALGHRKSLRKRSRRILDNWITIQEMLAYGTRAPDGRRVYNPLLSVTTV
ncbi:PDZ domain-containing protein 4-like, partial [Chiloscyllium plagiosum]|uniref:PDZ domain-containing protein 4-like n=1 Tax=Chiloscyllium plagiosum TaxID=36176 RepID=UPI001CB7F55E